jgi:hypothetical protein
MDYRPRGERDAYKLLYAAFMAAPIIAGIGKFTDKLGNWDKYLSDGVAEKLPVQRHTFMQAVGLIEVAAGLLVAAKPKWVAMSWARGSPASWRTSGPARVPRHSVAGHRLGTWRLGVGADRGGRAARTCRRGAASLTVESSNSRERNSRGT